MPDGFQQWSVPQWIDALEQTHRALCNTTISEVQVRMLSEVEPNARQEFFNRWIGNLLVSDAALHAQADAWMLDHFGIDYSDPISRVRIEQIGWDTPAYRDWLISSLRENKRFDQFVQCQLTSQCDLDSRIPTHAWYLAGQKAKFEILNNPTPIESSLVRQFRSALVSIQSTESMDYKRLLDLSQKESNEIKRWWQSQRGWPRVPAEELVWSWPSERLPEGPSDLDTRGLESMKSPLELGAGVTATVKQAPSIRGFREWTMVIAGVFSKELVESSEPIVLFLQSEDAQSTGDFHRRFILELHRGRLVVRMIHDSDLSSREIQTEGVIESDRTIQIAIINDGLGRADSLKILIDGKPCQTRDRQVADRYYKEFVLSKPNQWRVSGGVDSTWRLEHLQFYRLGLSIPECKGLAEGSWDQDWEEFDEELRTQWVEHYARRIDPQWRYQRESRSHYVANLAAILESQSMLPVLILIDQPIELVQPKRFPVSLNPDLDRLDFETKFQTLASDWTLPGKYLNLEGLSRGEAERTWRSMRRHLGLADQRSERVQAFPVSLVERFKTDFDRNKLLLGLVESLLGEIAK